MRKLKTARRPEILDAALAIVEERGLDAVSMRGVAASLGLTPMALYGYFRGKDDLLDGMVGRILDEIPKPPSSLDWRERLRALARGAREVAKRYPSAFPLLLTRPAVTPEALRLVDSLYGLLLEAGVPEREVARLERLLSTFVLGFVVSEVSGRFSRGSQSPARRRAGAGAGELPAHHRLGPLLDEPVDPRVEFEAGLDSLIILVEAARGS